LHLELRIDAKPTVKLFADGDEGQLHLADEIGAGIHCRFAGQEHVRALVHHVRHAVDMLGEHGDGLVEVGRLEVHAVDFEDLVVRS